MFLAIPSEPQTVGAIGAAILAKGFALNKNALQ